MTADDQEREAIKALLEGGLKVEVFPRADSDDDIVAIIESLKSSHGGLEDKLVLGGFTLTPVVHEGVEQACDTCMYYLVHRRFCELPELNVAVEPQWSCRLWRI